MGYEIFISYRRDDSFDITDRIYGDLRKVYGEKRVFRDLHSIKGGDNFEKVIKAALQSCSVMLVIIGDKWVTIENEKGQRLFQDGDVVRYEVEEGLRLGKKVIPVLVNDAAMPKKEQLPLSIQQLEFVRKHALEIRNGKDYARDMHDLVTAIGRPRNYLAMFVACLLCLAVILGFINQLVLDQLPGSIAPTGIIDGRVVVSMVQLANWQPQERVDEYGAEKYLVEMVKVPSGCFYMGSDSGGAIDEQPATVQCVGEFWMDRYEVTNEQFQKVMPDKRLPNIEFTEPFQPVNSILWDDAVAFCGQRGGRLPEEAEWEWAARGAFSREYPWGNSFDETNAAAYAVFFSTSNGGSQTSAVMDNNRNPLRPLGASWLGIYDMAGNVQEWTQGIYPQTDSVRRRVAKGGSFIATTDYLRAAARNPYPEVGETSPTIGFRCVQDT